MSAPDRKMLIDFNNKINALKNKTIENGCTQAEEDSALAKCEELIPKYNNLVDEYYANRNRHKTTVPYSSRIIPKSNKDNIDYEEFVRSLNINFTLSDDVNILNGIQEIHANFFDKIELDKLLDPFKSGGNFNISIKELVYLIAGNYVIKNKIEKISGWNNQNSVLELHYRNFLLNWQNDLVNFVHTMRLPEFNISEYIFSNEYVNDINEILMNNFILQDTTSLCKHFQSLYASDFYSSLIYSKIKEVISIEYHLNHFHPVVLRDIVNTISFHFDNTEKSIKLHRTQMLIYMLIVIVYNKTRGINNSFEYYDINENLFFNQFSITYTKKLNNLVIDDCKKIAAKESKDFYNNLLIFVKNCNVFELGNDVVSKFVPHLYGIVPIKTNDINKEIPQSGFMLKNKYYSVDSNMQIYVQLVKILIEQDKSFIKKLKNTEVLINPQHPTRKFIAKTRKDLHPNDPEYQHDLKYSVEISHDLYLNKNFASQSIEHNCKKICDIAGLVYGADFIIKIHHHSIPEYIQLILNLANKNNGKLSSDNVQKNKDWEQFCSMVGIDLETKNPMGAVRNKIFYKNKNKSFLDELKKYGINFKYDNNTLFFE